MAGITNTLLHQKYLTKQQSKVYGSLDKRLRACVDKFFCFRQKTQMHHLRFLLDTVKNHEKLETTVTFCFLRLFDSEDTTPHFDQLQSLQAENKLDKFFQFFATHQIDNLAEAITLFQKPSLPEEAIDVPEISSAKMDISQLLNCNFSFADTHSFIKEVLSAFPKSHRLPLFLYEKTLSVIDESTYDENEKNALAKLIVAITTNDPLAVGYTEADLGELIAAMQQVLALYGEEAFQSLCSTFAHSPVFLDELVRIIHLLNTQSEIPDIWDLLSTFVETNNAHLYEEGKKLLAQGLENRVPNIDLAGIPQEPFLSLRERFSTLPFPLSATQLAEIEENYLIIEKLCAEWKGLRMEELVNKATSIRTQKDISPHDVLQLISLARLALRIQFQIYLHPTQVLTLLGQLLFSKGCIAQVKTGEGKSMIFALFIFVLSMQNKEVHIISSSSNLAIRDQRKYEEFFKKFGLVTSCICDKNPPKDKFQADVLYGTASDFEFALMREMLNRTPLFRPSKNEKEAKRFDCVMIDEVDNLTIDTCLNAARLGLPAELLHDWVYPSLFRCIQTLCPTKADLMPQDAIMRARAFLETDREGRFHALVSALTEEQLGTWLNSARHALFELQENKHYIVRKDAILIVDADNTGRIMHDSRWSKGIHEFVEIKHDICVKQESLNPISLSHPVYYPMYQQVFGLTGTMGSLAEREEISLIYGIESFDVPTHRPSMRIDHPPEICPADIHLSTIIDKISSNRQKERPILVLCETIQKSQEIQELLHAKKIPHEMLNEIQEKTEEEVLALAGLPGAVTVATNTAGRGTDICLNSASLRNGGLHVILTFFPISLRGEEQARGRAGRQGQPGSSEMLIAETQASRKMEDLRSKREQAAIFLKELHICQAEMDRFRFSLATQFFQKLSTFHARLPMIITELSRDFATKRLIDPKPVCLDTLPPQDVPIARDAFILMAAEKNQDTPMRWKLLFSQAAERLHSLLLNDWAIHFYQKTDDLINRSEMSEVILIKELFNRFNPELADSIEANRKKTFDDLQQSVDYTFRSRMDVWNKYLDLTGKGLLHYLREVRLGRPLVIQDF